MAAVIGAVGAVVAAAVTALVTQGGTTHEKSEPATSPPATTTSSQPVLAPKLGSFTGVISTTVAGGTYDLTVPVQDGKVTYGTVTSEGSALDFAALQVKSEQSQGGFFNNNQSWHIQVSFDQNQNKYEAVISSASNAQFLYANKQPILQSSFSYLSTAPVDGSQQVDIINVRVAIPPLYNQKDFGQQYWYVQPEGNHFQLTP